jgi:hypothetical protein
LEKLGCGNLSKRLAHWLGKLGIVLGRKDWELEGCRAAGEPNLGIRGAQLDFGYLRKPADQLAQELAREDCRALFLNLGWDAAAYGPLQISGREFHLVIDGGQLYPAQDGHGRAAR